MPLDPGGNWPASTMPRRRFAWKALIRLYPASGATSLMAGNPACGASGSNLLLFDVLDVMRIFMAGNLQEQRTLRIVRSVTAL